MPTQQPTARFVLSRLPRGNWLSPDQIAQVVTQAGVEADPEYIRSIVRSWKRKGAVVTNSSNHVMRPASRVAAA
ncbi:hypothetical protein OG723_44315 (plasmid) [Streptomyces sp. NBC_01278]|uniref:hypothetical protein n=1 Tax=Streptomyces sp. NBC_01278 TaxID=2903809 RepID=UPI002E3017F1|nr:hypothetical protein [Streptomyces sp. NBC_01278]